MARHLDQQLPPPRPPAGLPPVPVRLFTVDEYHHMITTGLLDKYDKCELLEGWIVPHVVHDPPSCTAISLLLNCLRGRIGDEWLIRPRMPITLSDSEPEPDVSVTRGPIRRFMRSHPTEADTAFVIEVVQTDGDVNRTLHQRIYARAALPTFWIVNVADVCVEVYTDPVGGSIPAYRSRRDYPPGAAVPLVLDGVEVGSVPVSDILPLPPAEARP